MKDQVSIIIPAYNAARTLEVCLQNVFESISVGDEVIVVDDASTDSTLEIARKFNCRIISSIENKGAASSRNLGAVQAQNSILIFVDSDVVISRDNVEKVKKYFVDHENVHSLTMNVDTGKQEKGFLSDFKNLYMNFIISESGESVNYIYGSFCATRRKGYVSWPETLRLTEDSLWGFEQKTLGLEIHCLKNVEVIHLKNYHFLSLVKNDFLISSYFARAFLDNSRWSTLVSRESFGHTTKTQKVSVALAVLCTFILFLNPLLFVPVFMIWVLLNIKFIKFLSMKRGLVFTALSSAWYFFAYHVYFLGICHGCLKFIVSRSPVPEQEIA